jgi:hypothetical protein
MALLQEYERRAFIPFTGLVLAAFYLLLFLPLQRSSEKLDATLRPAWTNLVASLEQKTNIEALDFRSLTNHLLETQQALNILENTKRKTTQRLQLGRALRARMSGSFQLFDYDIERSKTKDTLARLAKERKVTINSNVFAGLPEYTTYVVQPALLWPALSMVDGLLAAAIQSQVSTLCSLESPSTFTNPPAAGSAGRLASIPFQLELAGPAASVLRFLQSLPLRDAELPVAGLPPVPTDKLPLFIDRVIIKKQAPDQPDEVHVWLRVVGFVIQE